MNDKTTDRAALTRVANLVKPALAAQPYVPALTHIRFGGGYATAFNDVAAIRVRSAAAEGRCVPGEMLIRALGSFSADSLAFVSDRSGALVLKSGRSSVKLPTLPAEAFPFEWPAAADALAEVAIDGAVLRGIERCLLSVGKDATHPAHMGVTLDAADGLAVLYSTDNVTISRYATDTPVELPGEAPVIMPRFFCEQLVALSRAFPEAERVMLLRDDGSIEACFGNDADLFTRTPVDVQPLDFAGIVGKFVKLGGLKSRLGKIPDGLDAALGRAMLVLAGEVLPRTRVSATKSGIVLESGTDLGQSVDEIDWGSAAELKDDVVINPEKVARGAKACALMAFTAKVTVLADAECDFVHIVAHVAA